MHKEETVEKGWVCIVYYDGDFVGWEQYSKFRKTRKESREYLNWKTAGGNPLYRVVKATFTTTTRWRQGYSKVEEVLKWEVPKNPPRIIKQQRIRGIYEEI